MFSSSSFTHVGSLSSGWEFSVCEIRFWVVVCVFSPHMGSHFFILLGCGFVFVMICGWVSSPNVFVTFSPLIAKLKIVFELPIELEERPHSLGCG